MESPGAYSFQQGLWQRTVSPRAKKSHLSILGWPRVSAKKTQTSKQGHRAGGTRWKLRQDLGRLGHTLVSHRFSCSMGVDGFPVPWGKEQPSSPHFRLYKECAPQE